MRMEPGGRNQSGRGRVRCPRIAEHRPAKDLNAKKQDGHRREAASKANSGKISSFLDM